MSHLTTRMDWQGALTVGPMCLNMPASRAETRKKVPVSMVRHQLEDHFFALLLVGVDPPIVEYPPCGYIKDPFFRGADLTRLGNLPLRPPGGPWICA